MSGTVLRCKGLLRCKRWECYMKPSDGMDSPSRQPDRGLRLDLVAGLTAAAVVLPKAMAYATVAGLPVSVGLYTAFVPMVVYALLGTSRVLSVSSTTTLAILAATELGTRRAGWRSRQADHRHRDAHRPDRGLLIAGFGPAAGVRCELHLRRRCSPASRRASAW